MFCKHDWPSLHPPSEATTSLWQPLCPPPPSLGKEAGPLNPTGVKLLLGRGGGGHCPCPGYLPLTAGNPEWTNERNRGSASPWQWAGCLMSKNGVRKCCRVMACHSRLPYKQPNHTSLLCRAKLVTQPTWWTRGPHWTWKDGYSADGKSFPLGSARTSLFKRTC